MAKVINILNFGAKGDGKDNDCAAIQQAIEASAPGDTVAFPVGKYKLTDTITLKPERTYAGEPGATLQWRGDKGFAMSTVTRQAHNITIKGLTFEGNDKGGGLAIDGSDQYPGDRVTIMDNTFQNITCSEYAYSEALFIPIGLGNSNIVHNTFINITGGSGIMAYNLGSNVAITHNQFNQIRGDCIHLMLDNQTNAKGITVSHNTGVGLQRMGIEIQSYENAHNSTVGLIVESNHFSGYVRAHPRDKEFPGTSASDGFDPDTFGLSIVQDGTGTIIRNNTLLGNKGTAWGIEVGTSKADVYGNRVEGYNIGIAVGPAHDASVHDNRIFNTQEAIWHNYLNLPNLNVKYVGNITQETSISPNVATSGTGVGSWLMDGPWIWGVGLILLLVWLSGMKRQSRRRA